MAASDWEEIKRLAADFQRAQLSSTSHKLSERNCIEIVNKLIQLGLIEVIYTTDGKEYLTPNQVEREIRDELLVHGGRINLVDLQQILNIDLSHVESKVNDIVRGDRHFCLIQGQLLDRDYLDRTAEEINETLQEAGQVTIADLAKTFNLPTDFLLSVIETRLGTSIHGQLDPLNRDVLFTAAFIARNIAKIRGIFSAITRPTHVVQLMAQYGLPEKLFFSVLQTLVESHRLAGAVQGRQEKALYVPDIYSKTQTNYIDSFLKQNGYIEYQTLTQLGITDCRQYLKKRYKDCKDYMYLPTCCIGSIIVDQVDAAIEDTLSNNHWVDVSSIVPSPFTDEDTSTLLQHCTKGPSRTTAMVFCNRIVASIHFVNKCKAVFEPLMKTKATQAVKLSPALFAELTKKERTELTESGTGDGKQLKKDERQKKALAGGSLKGGGGGRGARESGTKKTKNKYRDRTKGNQEEETSDTSTKKSGRQQELQFLSEDEILEVLQAKLSDCHDAEFLEEISSQIVRPLSREYQETAKSIFMSSATSAASKRKSHQDYQDKINGLWQNIKLFEKGLNLFEGDTRLQLCKHLLKSTATEVVNIIFELVANDNLMSLAENETFTSDSRLKLLSKLPGEWKVIMTKLNSSLNAKDLEDFLDTVERITGQEYCDLLLKKSEKKKERQMMFNHRQALIDQLERETEPAMALHLVTIILFQYHTNTLLHAPGRCVPHIISFLQKFISTEHLNRLTEYQNLVIQQISKKRTELNSEENDAENGESVKSDSVQLSEGLTDLKLIIKNMKKSTQEEI